MEKLKIWVKNMEKKDIRKLVAAKRKTLSQTEVETKSRIICEQIMKMEAFQKASCIFVLLLRRRPDAGRNYFSDADGEDGGGLKTAQ